jgi:hypothetical protein
LYYIDPQNRVFVLKKEKNYKRVKSMQKNSDSHILCVDTSNDILPRDKESTVLKKGEYEYIIDSEGKRISDAYEEVSDSSIVKLNNKYNKLVKK